MEKRGKQKEQESWYGKGGMLIQDQGAGVGRITRRSKPSFVVIFAHPLPINNGSGHKLESGC